MAINIETDLKEILNKLDTKLDKVANDVSEIKSEVAVLKANQENMKEKLSKIDGSQKAVAAFGCEYSYPKRATQIWSLITLVTGAVITLSLALLRKMPV